MENNDVLTVQVRYSNRKYARFFQISGAAFNEMKDLVKQSGGKFTTDYPLWLESLTAKFCYWKINAATLKAIKEKGWSVEAYDFFMKPIFTHSPNSLDPVLVQFRDSVPENGVTVFFFKKYDYKRHTEYWQAIKEVEARLKASYKQGDENFTQAIEGFKDQFGRPGTYTLEELRGVLNA